MTPRAVQLGVEVAMQRVTQRAASHPNCHPTGKGQHWTRTEWKRGEALNSVPAI
jgi:hypothetical protein